MSYTIPKPTTIKLSEKAISISQALRDAGLSVIPYYPAQLTTIATIDMESDLGQLVRVAALGGGVVHVADIHDNVRLVFFREGVAYTCSL